MSILNKVDLLIAGQGAAGFSAGLYAARYQMSTAIIGEEFGGETAIGGLIENYPGNNDIDGFDLMLEFKNQVTNLDVPIIEQNLKSITKKKLKTPSLQFKYDQMCITAKVLLRGCNSNHAYEILNTEGPFAVLPLGGDLFLSLIHI